MDGDLDVAEQPGRVRLVDRGGEDFVLREVLAADEDEHVCRLDRACGDKATLDETVRIRRHDLAILECARLRLVGVDDEVLRLCAPAVDERRLAAHREAGAAAAAQVRRHQLLSLIHI